MVLIVYLAASIIAYTLEILDACKSLNQQVYNYSKDGQLGVLIWVCNNLETKDKGKNYRRTIKLIQGSKKTPILRFEPISHMEAYFYLIKPYFCQE